MEPWKWLGKGNNSAIILRPENATEMHWLKDAVDSAGRASMTNLGKEGAAEEVHQLAQNAILPSTAVIMLSMLVSSYFSSLQYAFTKFIPECLITVVVAGFLGLFIRNMLLWGIFNTDSFELVDASILNLVLLPIIIFNGGWSMNLPHFSSQFTYCLIFAVGGTIVTMLVVGYSNWFLANYMGWDAMSGWRSNFAFAALISATDPVATLCTYAELDIARRQPLLNTLVLAESLMNDAVAIVFFDAVNSMDKPTWHGLQVGIMTRMMILLFGSMVFGILMASALIFLMRVARLPGQTSLEILYIFMAPFLTFALADTMELSGIIAVLFAGVMFRKYGTMHLTSRGRHLAGEFMEVVAKLADTGVFVLCGTSTALIDSRVGFALGFVAVALCLVARGVATAFCTASSNFLKHLRQEKPFITCKHAFMIWLGGLRGGIALVLALELDTHWCSTKTKEMIINTTFMVICSLLLICGGTTEFFLVALGMVPPPEEGPRKQSFDEADDKEEVARSWTKGSSPEEESSLDSEAVAIAEEHALLDVVNDRTARRVGNWLDSWFEYMLVGEFVEIQRTQSGVFSGVLS